MVRLIHTSDWQLGLKLAYVPDNRRVRALMARFDAIERIAALAQQHEVDAVVVAGDVFDDNAVGRDVLQQARDALAKFGEIPVLLLPGNHDPATPDAALERLGDLPQVKVLSTTEPYDEIPGIVFYPCPATSRMQREDPTAWIPSAGPAGSVRVAIAHGGAIDFAEDSDSPRLIDVQRILERGIDYVALGDWHGLLRFGPRAWYCGAPEATRFKEKDPGQVLLVEIEGVGEEPRVTPLPVARTRWLKETRSLDSTDDLDAFVSWIDTLEEKSWTLLELRLDGALSYGDLNRLDELLERCAEELLWLRIRENEVHAEPTEEDLARLQADGFVGAAAEDLKSRTESSSEGEEGDGAARDALRLLHRFLGEEDVR